MGRFNDRPNTLQLNFTANQTSIGMKIPSEWLLQNREQAKSQLLVQLNELKAIIFRQFDISPQEESTAMSSITERSVEKKGKVLRQISAGEIKLTAQEYESYIAKLTPAIINSVGLGSINTALHFAILHKKFAQAVILIESRKAELSKQIVNKKGKTPADLITEQLAIQTQPPQELLRLALLLNVGQENISSPTPGMKM
jgi:hypothetical protein